MASACMSIKMTRASCLLQNTTPDNHRVRTPDLQTVYSLGRCAVASHTRAYLCSSSRLGRARPRDVASPFELHPHRLSTLCSQRISSSSRSSKDSRSETRYTPLSADLQYPVIKTAVSTSQIVTTADH